MKKQINDLLLKMQTGDNCIGETANKLLDLYSVSSTFVCECRPTGVLETQTLTTCSNCNKEVKTFRAN